jgi:hypothetical protein
MMIFGFCHVLHIGPKWTIKPPPKFVINFFSHNMFFNQWKIVMCEDEKIINTLYEKIVPIATRPMYLESV